MPCIDATVYIGSNVPGSLSKVWTASNPKGPSVHRDCHVQSLIGGSPLPKFKRLSLATEPIPRRFQNANACSANMNWAVRNVHNRQTGTSQACAEENRNWLMSRPVCVCPRRGFCSPSDPPEAKVSSRRRAGLSL